MPSIGRTVAYTNLGDKDGKYPPEVQAAVITGIYRKDPNASTCEPSVNGNNDPKKVAVATANTVGQQADTNYADLKVFYRTGLFDMVCVPFSDEPKRGHWNWPVKL